MAELSVLSSWNEMVKGQIDERISKLEQNFKQPTGKVLQNADVKACLSDLHSKYVFVPADKAPNSIIIIRKRYYIETLIKELSYINLQWSIGSSKCTTKQLSSLLTKILTMIKSGLKKYCSVKTSHTEVNNMWILKNSTNLLSSLDHLGVCKATSIQTFDFSTLCTSIPHDLLKSRMNNIINNAFKHKIGATQYIHIKLTEIKAISPVIL